MISVRTIAIPILLLSFIIILFSASRQLIYADDIAISKTALSNNLVSNPDFAVINNNNSQSNWQDVYKLCTYLFKCTTNSTDGWNDRMSLQVSTTNLTRSDIISKGIPVRPNEKYELLTHMKANKWAIGSFIFLEGFNETSKKWHQIIQCPPPDGSLKWHEYSCELTIPKSMSEVRVGLVAGWSYQKNQEAVTLFDAIYMRRIMPQNAVTARVTSNETS
jgi:hypothetical protein